MPKYPCDCEQLEVNCIICAETFERANNSDITVNDECDTNVISGTPSIESNQLKIDDIDTLIIYEDHPSYDDVYSIGCYRHTFDFELAAGNEIKFIFNYLDSNNYYYILWDEPNDTIDFRKVDGGVDSRLELPDLYKLNDNFSGQWATEYYDQTVQYVDSTNLIAGKNWRLIVWTQSVELTIGSGLAKHFIKAELINVDDGKILHLDSRVDTDSFLTYVDKDTTYGRYFGIGTTSTHSGNLLVNEIAQEHCSQTAILTPTTGPLQRCKLPTCWICLHQDYDFTNKLDNPPTDLESYINYDALDRPRACAFTVISGSPEFSDQIYFNEGDEIELNEIDPQYEENWSLIFHLGVDPFSYYSLSNQGLVFHLIFNYQDSNNYDYIEFENGYVSNFWDGNLKCNLKRVIAGVTSTYGEKVYSIIKPPTGGIFAYLSLTKSKSVEGLAFNMQPTPVTNIVDDGYTLLRIGEIGINRLWESFWYPLNPVNSGASSFTVSKQTMQKIPDSDNVFGKIRFKAVSVPSDINRLSISFLGLRRDSYNCGNTKWIDCCQTRNFPKAYQATINFLNGDSFSCDESAGSGDFLFKRVHLEQRSHVYANKIHHSYFIEDAEICDLGFGNFLKFNAVFHIVITNMTATQFSLYYYMELNSQAAISPAYSHSQNVSQTTPIDCETATITLTRSGNLANHGSFNHWPYTILFTPIN